MGCGYCAVLQRARSPGADVAGGGATPAQRLCERVELAEAIGDRRLVLRVVDAGLRLLV